MLFIAVVLFLFFFFSSATIMAMDIKMPTKIISKLPLIHNFFL